MAKYSVFVYNGEQMDFVCDSNEDPVVIVDCLMKLWPEASGYSVNPYIANTGEEETDEVVEHGLVEQPTEVERPVITPANVAGKGSKYAAD